MWVLKGLLAFLLIECSILVSVGIITAMLPR